MCKMFDESPSHWADYEKITLSTENGYPLQFMIQDGSKIKLLPKKAQQIWPKFRDIANFWS